VPTSPPSGGDRIRTCRKLDHDADFAMAILDDGRKLDAITASPDRSLNAVEAVDPPAPRAAKPNAAPDN
jgi:hypothetical protein